MGRESWTTIGQRIVETANESKVRLEDARLKRSRKYGRFLLVKTNANSATELQRSLQFAERIRQIFKEKNRHGALEIILPQNKAIHIPMNFSKNIRYPEINGVSLHHGPSKEPPGKYAIAPFGNRHVFDDVGLISPSAVETDFDIFTARGENGKLGITVGEILTSYHDRIRYKAEKWAEFFEILKNKGIVEEGGPTIYAVYPPGERERVTKLVKDAMHDAGWKRYGYVAVSQRVDNMWRDILRSLKIIPEQQRKQFLYNARDALYDAARGDVSRLFAYCELSDALGRGRKYINNKKIKAGTRGKIFQEILRFDEYYKHYGPTEATEELMREIARLLPNGMGKRLKIQLGI